MKRLLLSLILVICGIQISFGCTTVVVSGKYTEDGRPLMWKLRDTDFEKNKVHFFQGENYSFTGVVNSSDAEGKDVWGGINSAGFAIMNSASFNLRMNDEATVKDREGIIMKMALGRCETLSDFEKLLNELPKPWGLEANFGVIDAHGGAAYYETSDEGFVKFDANDSQVAPAGYLIRSNYSFTGKKDVGYGYIRYQTAQELMSQWNGMGEITWKTLVSKAPRTLKHSLLGVDYASLPLSGNEAHHFVNSGDLIVRHGSASSMAFQGVKPGDDVRKTVMWVTIGFPLTCVSLPVWNGDEDMIPELLKAKGGANCWLNQQALELKRACFPVEPSSGYKYLDLVPLFCGDSAILPRIKVAEENIFKAYAGMKGKVDTKSITAFYRKAIPFVKNIYD